MPVFQPYISKDYVIYGSLLELDPARSWSKIHKRTRTAIRKARTFNTRIVKVAGSRDDIAAFRPFCPNREDLPEQLGSRQHMYIAYLGDEIAGGIVVTELSPEKLYLHFHAATDAGKKRHIPSLLLWHIVEAFGPTPFEHLDVGASYRPALQKYFSSWATKQYPVVMRPPEYKPQILINPVENMHVSHGAHVLGNEDEGKRLVADFFRIGEFTYFPRGMYAIYALFRWMRLEGRIGSEDEVYISTNTESPYVSSCVTSAIEQVCKWSRTISEKTKAIFAIHEFGFPHPRIAELRRVADQRGIPLVEDCAYAWASGDAGRYGDFVIYSLTKVFPMQFGGFLVGKRFDPEYVWNTLRCGDANKESVAFRQLAMELPRFEEMRRRRQEHYAYYQELFGPDRTLFGPVARDAFPGAYMLRLESEEDMEETSAFVRGFGVECGNYWKNAAIFLPVHQNLTAAEREYIAGAVFGAKSYERITKKLKIS